MTYKLLWVINDNRVELVSTSDDVFELVSIARKEFGISNRLQNELISKSYTHFENNGNLETLEIDYDWN